MEAIKNLITEKISGEWGVDANPGEGVNVIRTTNFTNLGIIDFKNVVKRGINVKKISQKKLRKGDIIIEKSGGSPTQPVGRVVFFDLDTKDDYLCNNFTTILRPDSVKVYPKFLFYQLFIGHLRGRTLKYQNKTTGIINLKLDNYLNEKIIVPPILDQIRIATILSKVEVLIAKRKDSINLLESFLSSSFLKMFGDPTKDSDKWKMVLLSELGKLDRGVSKHRPRNAPELLGGDYPLIQTGDIRRAGLYIEKYTQTYSEIGLKQSKLWPKDTLCITIAANIGKTSILSFDACFPDSVVGFTPYEKEANAVYVHYLFGFIQTILERNAPQSAQKNINLEILRNLSVPKPSIKLQNEFAKIVSKGETIKKLYEENLNELENLFSSLCQKAFSGDLDLSKVQIEENYSRTDGIGNDNNNEIVKPFNTSKKISKKEKKHIADIRNFLEESELKYADSGKNLSPEEIKKYFEDELKKLERGEGDYIDRSHGDPFDIDIETAKKQGKWFYSEWKKLHPKKPKGKITWDKVSIQQIAEWTKEKYRGFHFSSEMLMNFLMAEHITLLDYYSSEELKKYPHLNSADDMKTFIFSALCDENPFIKLEQQFYNAEKQNFELNVTKEDKELIKEQDFEIQSGIYFCIA